MRRLAALCALLGLGSTSCQIGPAGVRTAVAGAALAGLIVTRVLDAARGRTVEPDLGEYSWRLGRPVPRQCSVLPPPDHVEGCAFEGVRTHDERSRCVYFCAQHCWFHWGTQGRIWY